MSEFDESTALYFEINKSKIYSYRMIYVKQFLYYRIATNLITVCYNDDKNVMIRRCRALHLTSFT